MFVHCCDMMYWDLMQYASHWHMDLSDPLEVERKVEELQWMSVILYAVSGWKEGQKFQADFFL